MTDALALFDVDEVAPVDAAHAGCVHIGRCTRTGCQHTTARRSAADHAAVCPTHRRPLRWHKVDGTHSDGIKCNATCQYAKGPQCSCQCDGYNHGAGWIE